MEKKNKNKIIFIIITLIAFLLILTGGIFTIISVLIKEINLLYIGVPMIGIAFVIYVILFFILYFYNKKKE